MGFAQKAGTIAATTHVAVSFAAFIGYCRCCGLLFWGVGNRKLNCN
jgi:hypothetical protein